MRKNNNYKVKYTVLSRGSEEKGGFKGYIWVGENIRNKKWVITQDEHGVDKSIQNKNILQCNKNKRNCYCKISINGCNNDEKE